MVCANVADLHARVCQDEYEDMADHLAQQQEDYEDMAGQSSKAGHAGSPFGDEGYEVPVVQDNGVEDPYEMPSEDYGQIALVRLLHAAFELESSRAVCKPLTCVLACVLETQI